MKAGNRLLLATLLVAASALRGAESGEDAYRPHTPTLLFHLTHAGEAGDVDAIRASVQKLASVSKVEFGAGAVRVRFDSHVVSYHQVAQAIADAGAARGKDFAPGLRFTVPEYAADGNAAKVDALLAGKRLNQRVRIEALDKSRGEFVIHFLPLAPDPATTGPFGFNGGHLNHPLHDPPPRGLGLTCRYESDDAATNRRSESRPFNLGAPPFISVSVIAGQTALTRIPLSANSSATVFVRPMTADLVAL